MPDLVLHSTSGRRFLGFQKSRAAAYGQKDGESPTFGKQAATYIVTLPDGTAARKCSFKAIQEEAIAAIYYFDGWRLGAREQVTAEIGWHVAGVFDSVADMPLAIRGYDTAPAIRVG